MKNDAADKLIVIVSAENEIVQKEKQFGKNFLKHFLRQSSLNIFMNTI